MFGKRLKQLREEKNLTQAELAEYLNKSASAIGMYEREKRYPNLDFITDCAEFFDVTTDYLLGRSNQKYLLNEDTISFHAEKKISDKNLKTLRKIVTTYLESLED